MKYSKGPWENNTKETLGCHWIRDRDGNGLAWTDGAPDDEIEDGNTSLMTAAPDMYEALKEARDELCSHPDYKTLESLAMFDKAIAKAEGNA